MEKSNLDQFKVETKIEGRLTLDQFKSQSNNNENNEELEKLTGGVLGACHGWWDATKAYLKECVVAWNQLHPN